MKIEDTLLIKNRGWVVTLTLDCDEPPLGAKVRRVSDGRDWVIKGVEWWAITRRPAAGDPIGLLVVAPGLEHGDEVEFTTNG